MVGVIESSACAGLGIVLLCCGHKKPALYSPHSLCALLEVRINIAPGWEVSPLGGKHKRMVGAVWPLSLWFVDVDIL